MKQYNILISDSAENDLDKIYRYIAFELCAPETAEKQYNRIMKKIMDLETFPDRIRIMENKAGKNLKLRRLLVDNYSVIFKIEGSHVSVANVLCNASNIEERLLR